ncbi:Rft protein-domain-containing protein [Dichotomocladium elegans]|nr:Rft protein-domain-containing protein [Dichotomocladium elegans]
MAGKASKDDIDGVSTKEQDQAKGNLLASTAKGAYYLVLLQFASRMLTFGLHQIVLRYTSAETLGIASVKLELLLSTILFISREGFRCALLRSSEEEKTERRDMAEQKVTNLAYIPTGIGLLTTICACGYYISMIDESTATKYPYYRVSVLMFGAGAFAELLIEPLFVLAMNRLYFSLRVSVEGVAVLIRCFVTFGLTLAGVSAGSSSHNAYGVLAFAVAQLAFGLTMMVGYVGFFCKKVLRKEIQARNLVPQQLKLPDGRKYYFDKAMGNLAWTLTKQSLLKHVLTEGDKMLISALCSDNDQGIYAFVVNYGSLVVRILFQPLEEASRTFFSKLLGGNQKRKSMSDLQTASDVLLMTLRSHVMLGLLFICFATNYTATLIDLLVGREWSVNRNAPAVLAMYCAYVPVMGVNGITEAFVQAVATKDDLNKLSYYMIGFSACFIIAGYGFMSVLELGAIGLVLANMVNLSVRIAYSWGYITRYFQQQSQHLSGQLRVRNWFPNVITVGSFVISWVITRWSEEKVGWQTLRQKAIHIAIGGVCFLFVAGIT